MQSVIWVHDVACHQTDYVQHAVPHVCELMEIVGKCRCWMADSSDKETAALVNYHYYVRAGMKEQKL